MDYKISRANPTYRVPLPYIIAYVCGVMLLFYSKPRVLERVECLFHPVQILQHLVIRLHRDIEQFIVKFDEVQNYPQFKPHYLVMRDLRGELGRFVDDLFVQILIT